MDAEFEKVVELLVQLNERRGRRLRETTAAYVCEHAALLAASADPTDREAAKAVTVVDGVATLSAGSLTALVDAQGKPPASPGPS